MLSEIPSKQNYKLPYNRRKENEWTRVKHVLNNNEYPHDHRNRDGPQN